MVKFSNIHGAKILALKESKVVVSIGQSQKTFFVTSDATILQSMLSKFPKFVSHIPTSI